MDAERRILTDGAIAIRAGRIAAVGPDRQVATAVQAARVRDLSGALVHPGLIDAHVHLGMDVARGLAPKSSGDWSAVEEVLFAAPTPEQEHLATLQSCIEMVANGTTTFADTGSSFDLDAVTEGIQRVGLRGLPGYMISDCPGELEALQAPTDVCLARLEEQLDRYPFDAAGRVRCAVSLSGMGMCSDQLLVDAAALAERRRVPMIMHQSWSEDEVRESMARHGRRPLEHLADLGVLRPNLSLVHMIQVDEGEVELVATAGSAVVHCPAASARRAMGAIRFGRFPEMLRAGTPVALGSDGFSSKHDVARQAYLAATLFREVRGQMPAITAETALEMATLHGARALGMQAEIGSLEVGKRADVVIHTLDRPEAHPRWHDPVDSLVFFAGSSTVATVLVEGEVIYDGGQFARFDAREALARIDAAAARLQQVIGADRFSLWPLVG